MNSMAQGKSNRVRREWYKVEFHAKRLLYKTLGIKLPKLKDQRGYWNYRSNSYFREVFENGYHDREVFFQDMIVREMKQLAFDSCFEAGCGFGWNVKRMKDEFPLKRVGGIDFSIVQLANAQSYLNGSQIRTVNADNCAMPLKDNAFDVGFSLGVFMNIHPARIRQALTEMARVCGKYIIHLEWQEDYARRELREKRAFKTNIISHNYGELYQAMNLKVLKILTHRDFEQDYLKFMRSVQKADTRWEGFEGPDKYTLTLVEVNR